MKTSKLALLSLIAVLGLYAVVNLSLMNHTDSKIDEFMNNDVIAESLDN